MRVLYCVPLLILLATAGCSDAPPPPAPYPVISAGCTNWQANASIAMAGDVRINASAPRAGAKGGVELDLAYFIPETGRADLARTRFSLTVPHGAVIASVGTGPVLRVLPPYEPGKALLLPTLPPRLLGEAFGGNVIYRMVLRFPGPLPERFDLTPPDMTIDGQAYAVTTLTYRYFPERKAYGLCN